MGFLLKWISIVAFATIILSGCKNRFETGHYQGSLTLGSSSSDQVSDLNSSSAIPVGIDITSDGLRSGTIRVQGDSQKFIDTIKFSHLKKGVYRLTFSLFGGKEVVLKKKAGCYVAESPLVVDACFVEREFVLNVHDPVTKKFLRLVADPFHRRKPIELEDPKKYRLEELLDLALTQNLDSKAEFEKMTQATLRARAAWLSLFPRLNIRAGVPLRTLPEPVSFALVSVCSSLGDFLPVILPSRWLRAYSSSYLGEAQKIAFKAVKANLMTQVETLAFVSDQQSRMKQGYEHVIEILERFKPALAQQIESKQLAENKYQDFEQILGELKVDLIRVKNQDLASRRALAQAIGLKNPDGLSEVLIPYGNSLFPKDLRFNQVELLKLARERSFELEQVYHLIRAAKYERKSKWFLGLDSTADQTYSFGPALPTLIEVEASKVRELEVMATKMEQDLAQKVYETVTIYHQGIELLNQSTETFQVSLVGIQELLSGALATPGTFAPDLLVNRTQRYLRNLGRRESLIADIRIALSRIDRLLLRGSYDRLLPHRSAARSLSLFGG